MKKYFQALCLCCFIAQPCYGGTERAEHTTESKKIVTKSKKKLDLGQIFRKYGSDKDSHRYTLFYQALFHRLRNKPITLLEIGIGTMIPHVNSSMVGYGLPGYKPGGSLRAWRDFFTEGTIYGIDIQPDTQFTDEPRIFTHLCNSTDKTAVQKLMKDLNGIKFDIIVDDGSHLDSDQLSTLENLYPHLKKGGFYIIEDLTETNRLLANPNEISKRCNDDPCFFVGLKNEAVVIHKKHLQKPLHPF